MGVLERISNVIAIFTEPPRTRSHTMPPSLPDHEFQAAMHYAGWDRAGSEPYPEDQARAYLQQIIDSDFSPAVKYEMLHGLDVRVQNQCERGLASPVIGEIKEKQYQCIKEMRRE